MQFVKKEYYQILQNFHFKPLLLQFLVYRVSMLPVKIWLNFRLLSIINKTLFLLDQAKLNSSPKFLSNKEVKLDFGEVRKNYGGIWTSVVLCKFSKEQYKRSLIMLNEKVYIFSIFYRLTQIWWHSHLNDLVFWC
jgi:hypothetical protein